MTHLFFFVLPKVPLVQINSGKPLTLNRMERKRKEKKLFIKKRFGIKESSHLLRSNLYIKMCLCFCDCILVLLAVLFPPLPVWIKRGLCSADSLINILLCCLGYFPGLIHSWYIISRYPEDRYIIFDEEQQLYIPPNQGTVHHHTVYVSVPSPSLSPVNNNNNIAPEAHYNYDSTNQEPIEAPPDYDNVINETAKNTH